MLFGLDRHSRMRLIKLCGGRVGSLIGVGVGGEACVENGGGGDERETFEQRVPCMPASGPCLIMNVDLSLAFSPMLITSQG